jgi:hypothetical protein
MNVRMRAEIYKTNLDVEVGGQLPILEGLEAEYPRYRAHPQKTIYDTEAGNDLRLREGSPVLCPLLDDGVYCSYGQRVQGLVHVLVLLHRIRIGAGKRLPLSSGNTPRSVHRPWITSSTSWWQACQNTKPLRGDCLWFRKPHVKGSKYMGGWKTELCW